ncbi:MAG: uroporphyrinogen-III synthase [Phycisphaerae bacterium]|nr:uroporphyrinogen-III synthase [Phycisphaerae bacterium]
MIRVWVTREEDDDGPLCHALRAAALEPVLEPVIERRILGDAHLVIGSLAAEDWLVLTSPFAVNAVEPGSARVPKVAVVGEPSRQVALARGFRVELVGKGDGESLFEMLRHHVHHGRVCYPRSSLVTPPHPWSDVEILSPILYETTRRDFDRDVVHRVDVISVASASAVRAVGKYDKRYASIGSTTTKALRELGVDPWVQAETPSFEALAQVIAKAAKVP